MRPLPTGRPRFFVPVAAFRPDFAGFRPERLRGLGATAISITHDMTSARKIAVFIQTVLVLVLIVGSLMYAESA